MIVNFDTYRLLQFENEFGKFIEQTKNNNIDQRIETFFTLFKKAKTYRRKEKIINKLNEILTIYEQKHEKGMDFTIKYLANHLTELWNITIPKVKGKENINTFDLMPYLTLMNQVSIIGNYYPLNEILNMLLPKNENLWIFHKMISNPQLIFAFEIIQKTLNETCTTLTVDDMTKILTIGKKRSTEQMININIFDLISTQLELQEYSEIDELTREKYEKFIGDLITCLCINLEPSIDLGIDSLYKILDKTKKSFTCKQIGKIIEIIKKEKDSLGVELENRYLGLMIIRNNLKIKGILNEAYINVILDTIFAEQTAIINKTNLQNPSISSKEIEKMIQININNSSMIKEGLGILDDWLKLDKTNIEKIAEGTKQQIEMIISDSYFKDIINENKFGELYLVSIAQMMDRIQNITDDDEEKMRILYAIANESGVKKIINSDAEIINPITAVREINDRWGSKSKNRVETMEKINRVLLRVD